MDIPNLDLPDPPTQPSPRALNTFLRLVMGLVLVACGCFAVYLVAMFLLVFVMGDGR